MTFDLTQFFLLGLLTSSVHWLIARSEIAKPLWSRAHGWLGALLACAGCSGFWLGAVACGSGRVLPFANDDAFVFDWITQGLLGGVLGIFVTPVFESILLWGLEQSAIDADEDGGVPTEPAPVVDSRSYDTPVSNPMRRPK